MKLILKIYLYDRCGIGAFDVELYFICNSPQSVYASQF